jgi:hypothetical protein
MDPVLRKVISNARYYWLAEKGFLGEEPDPGEVYMKVYDEFTYTSGTPLGQIGRIEKVQAARNNVAPGDRISPKVSFTQVNPIGLAQNANLKFDRPRVPSLDEFASTVDQLSWFDNQFKYAEKDSEFSSVTINMMSSTGIWSGSATKKN